MTSRTSRNRLSALILIFLIFILTMPSIELVAVMSTPGVADTDRALSPTFSAPETVTTTPVSFIATLPPLSVSTGRAASPTPGMTASKTEPSIDRKPQEKISAGIARLLENPVSSGETSAASTQHTDRFTVRIEAAPDHTATVKRLVRQNGGDVTVRTSGTLLASLSRSAVLSLTESDAVDFVQRPVQGDPVAVDSVTSEGVSMTTATAVQQAGITGENVTVAVIDRGFNASNPEFADNVIETKNVRADSSFTNKTDQHGSAVAEVVTDVAPSVNLVLVSTPNIYAVEVKKAIKYVQTNTSADVVTMSLGFYTGPFDGTSSMADLIETGAQNGTTHVIAAGNSGGGNHFHTTWTDGDNDDWLEFSGTDEGLEIDVSQGEPFGVYVNWNGYPTTNQDYDIILMNNSGRVVDSSNTSQTGTQPPMEYIYRSSAQDPPYELSIKNHSADGKATFQIFGTKRTSFEYSTSAQSITRPAAEETAITTGAVYYKDNELESFSSRGPTVDGRLKPDIVAPDGVSSSIYGDVPNGFYGTSAAAPHVAGALALVHEVNGSLSTTAQKRLIRQSADIVQSPQPNNQTGYGLVNATAAVESASSVDISSNQTYIVKQDGNGDFATIQSALNNTSSGDTVKVRPGIYSESIVLSKNITLTAPTGATLQNASRVSNSSGVHISKSAAPVVSGFTFTDWSSAVNASGTDTSWTLRNTTIKNGLSGITAVDSTGGWAVDNATVNVEQVGLLANRSRGDWAIADSVFADNSHGALLVSNSSGGWTVQNTTLMSSSGAGLIAEATSGNWIINSSTIWDLEGDGIDAHNSTGNWTVEQSAIHNNSGYGITATESAGNWIVRDTAITGTNTAITAAETAGNWTLANVTVARSNQGLVACDSGGNWTVRNTTIRGAIYGINATNTVGVWDIHKSVFVNNTMHALDATNAQFEGNATKNYWGATDGPNGDFPGTGASVFGNATVAPFYTNISFSDLNGGWSPQPVLVATLNSSVNNVGSPVPIQGWVNDSGGIITDIQLHSTNRTRLDGGSCASEDCTITLSVTPRDSTWNGTGYENRTFLVTGITDGTVIDETTVRTEVYIEGDTNGDGVVSIFDAVAVGRSWQAERNDSGYSDAADLNNDGSVDIFDAVAIGRNWQDRA